MSNFFKLIILIFLFVWGFKRIWNWIMYRIQPKNIRFLWLYSLNKLWLKPQDSYIRRFMIYMLVGLGIFLLVFFFRNTAIFKGIENEGIDTLMQIRQEMIPSNPTIPSFVLLDIDDNTHQAWNEPMFTPRDRVLNLITSAVNAEARLVIVDIDLSRKTPMDGLEKYTKGLKHHPYDQALFDYLSAYKAACLHKPCPPIILARTLKSSSSSIHNTRPSFLDEAVNKSKPYVQWASTLFFRDEDTIRHWSLWQPACSVQQPTVIPSIQLLAAGLIRNGIKHQTAGLKQELQYFQPQDCFGTATKHLPPENIKIGKLTVNTGQHGIQQRIMFSIPWKIHNNKNIKYSLKDKTGKTIISIFPAKEFAKLPLTANLEALKNSIVVIGGSYSGGHDIHLTPLDEMPGALIIINAIHTLLEYGELQPLPNWLKILIYFALLVLSCLVLARFGYGRGLIIPFILIFVVLILSSIFLFHYGIWLDFMLPLSVLMQLLPL